MGIDCRIILPGNVRIRDVSDVMGAAAGLRPEQYQIDGKGIFMRVPGVVVSGYGTQGLETCARITFLDHEVMYHFEYRGGCRLLIPRSTPFWLAIGYRLVEFFGGELIAMDCDDKVVFSRPARDDSWNHAEDGEPWARLQKRKLEVRPLDAEELDTAKSLAAYPNH